MKKILISLAVIITIYNCENVVEIDLNEVPPRLVIDAGIRWFKNTAGNEQSIKLSLTVPFFQ